MRACVLPPSLVSEYRKRVDAKKTKATKKRKMTSVADVEEKDTQPSLLSQLLDSREKKKSETKKMKERINHEACTCPRSIPLVHRMMYLSHGCVATLTLNSSPPYDR